MALSKFRNFDHFNKDHTITKSSDFQNRKTPILNDEDLAKELKKQHLARISSGQSLEQRMTDCSKYYTKQEIENIINS